MARVESQRDSKKEKSRSLTSVNVMFTVKVKFILEQATKVQMALDGVGT
jgi:hypothetical protein